ncbi:unnamed protein product [Didymodactylos carnosus]|uniref:EGF-like domain-containing protein n=1 Tax=Didymodactylos carnosus TaxID=1234261 RepID=A0A815GYJ1_9BILA|nr:unnamed protein product [Didymodactylos carnosus]CAF1344429.1 unnamed protein product [Didymodactylos carnosus]CAF3774434.1 unnamed protein product [Didymodactylos carnosus]CAF4208673.1 unnamed protein product [Didymodactylos carnosus]
MLRSLWYGLLLLLIVACQLAWSISESTSCQLKLQYSKNTCGSKDDPCDEHATCSYDTTTKVVNCTCEDGYVGNGTSGNCQENTIVIYRVGDGTSTLTSAGTPVFLDEYTFTGIFVKTTSLPTTVSGSNMKLVASGTATLEGLMTLSTDGRFVMLTGYNADIGSATVATSSVSRVVGRVDKNGTIDTTTTANLSGQGIRSAASTNGMDIWFAGTAGLLYTTLGSNTFTNISATVTNIRQTAIFANQLYVSTSTGSSVRIGSVGTALPTVQFHFSSLI